MGTIFESYKMSNIDIKKQYDALIKSRGLKKKLSDLLKDHDVTGNQFAFQDFETSFEDALKEQLGDYEYILECERSNDGDHDGSKTVVHFKDHDIYIMVCGSYHSEYGCEFDNTLYVVEPKQVTYTEYHVVKGT